MNTSPWFDDLPVIGKMPPEQAAAKLREVGEAEAAEMLRNLKRDYRQSSGVELVRIGGPFKTNPGSTPLTPSATWLPLLPGTNALPIHHVGNIPADPSLKHARIKIALNRLRVASYPGGGMHRVLLHFFAQNQVPGKTENMHFNATYRVREGDTRVSTATPSSLACMSATEGMAFKCRTINVQNDQDEAVLDFLESDVFKAGLKLVNTAQPVIAPFSELALGLARTIAKRHRNVSVQDFDLGLDFSTIPMGARLAEGSYLAVQIPENHQLRWDWHEWIYHPASEQVVQKATPNN